MPGILCRWITRQEWYRRFFSDVYLQTGISGMVHQRQIITVRWGAVDALLGVLCALYCISGMRSGQAVSAVALENAFRYAVWYFCAKIFFSFNSGLPSILAFSAMCLWGVTESVTGLRTYAVRSRSVRYDRQFLQSRTIRRVCSHDDCRSCRLPDKAQEDMGYAQPSFFPRTEDNKG